MKNKQDSKHTYAIARSHKPQNKTFKGDISINTLIAILLGIILLAVIVYLIISWKNKAVEVAGGVLDVKPKHMPF